jgi:KDO2-lipid IV(A) lauroyltransferase
MLEYAPFLPTSSWYEASKRGILLRAENIPDPVASKSEVEAKQAPRQWYVHSYNRPAFYRLAAVCSLLIPRPLRFGLARTIAPVFQRLMPHENAAVRRNMAHILPGAEARAVERVVQALFRNFAYFFAELVSLNRQPLPVLQRYVHRVHGLEHLQAAVSSPRGFVAATAHMGNWELAGRLLTPFVKGVHVLTAPERDATIQRLLREQHIPAGLRFVTNETAGVFVQLLMALRRGEVVAVQVDRVTGHRSDLPVAFFGAPALFPSGPFVLARAAQVPVVPFFCLMRLDHQYDIFIDQAITVSRGHEEVALQQMIRVLERYVAMAPDQWFNFYDVWENTSS